MYRFAGNGMPEVVKHSRLRVDNIGVAIDGRGGSPIAFWTFIVRSQSEPMSNVTIRYVGEPTIEALTVRDTAAQGTDKFVTTGPREPLERFKFLDDGEDNLFLFRFDVTFQDGTTSSVYQPTVIGRGFEEAARMMSR